MAQLSLDDLAVFVRVVEHGGFASAARELGTPTSTVSRAVERLEARAGVRLLNRSTRQVGVTSDGRDLYVAIAPSVSALRATAQTLEPASKLASGKLRVTAASDLCNGLLSSVVAAFVERYPLVQLDFVVSNRRVNMIDEGIDVALRASPSLGDSTLVARKLGVIRQRLFAAPKYLERHGAPSTPSDLGHHHTLLFRAENLARSWQLEGPDGAVPVSLRGRIASDDFSFLRATAIAGAGIALLPEINSAEDVDSGRLRRVLPEYSTAGATLYLMYPSRRQVPPRVSAFRDFVAESLARPELAHFFSA
jgi:DNA-binding transcriptional LysR family regulator